MEILRKTKIKNPIKIQKIIYKEINIVYIKGSVPSLDYVAEWLRRWPAKPLGSARACSIHVVVVFCPYGVMDNINDF